MDELGKSLPLSEGYIDAENSAKAPEADGPRTCLNCGTPLTDRFCSHCGQKDIPKRQTLGELIENFVGSFFSFESKFFRTLRYLLFKPGFLAKEYNSGRRESYYHPARMYVFTSFVYFLLVFSLPDAQEERNDVIQTDSTDVKLDSIATGADALNFQLTEGEYDSREEYDSIQQTLPASERDGWFVRKMNYRQIELSDRYRQDKANFGSDFIAAFVGNAPKVFFFLLPIFALILKLLYVRRDFYYSEHLAFSTYFYNFFFTIGIISELVRLIPGLDWFSLIVWILLNVYLLVAMKRVYEQGWGKSILKFVLLAGTFGICIALGLFANLLLTLMFI